MLCHLSACLYSGQTASQNWKSMRWCKVIHSVSPTESESSPSANRVCHLWEL
jgi:hypothetical protein